MGGETAPQVFTKTDMIGRLNNWPVNKYTEDFGRVR